MPTLGHRHKLRLLRTTTPGAYLDGENLGDILLPGPLVPYGAVVGQEIDVFIHRDSEDRIVATTETPYAVAGEFALLRVTNVNERLGSFLDWGLAKDLLLPEREQTRELQVGDWVVVYLTVDPRSDRMMASAKLNRFLNLTEPAYKPGQHVDLLIADESDLGFSAIINNAHKGLLYHNELASPLAIGERLPGYVRQIRPDGKIDLSLDASGYQRIAPLADRILETLASRGGRLPLNDKSSPEEIRAAFDASKKAFKQAIGALYKERKITIENFGIRLVRQENAPPLPPKVKP